MIAWTGPILGEAVARRIVGFIKAWLDRGRKLAGIVQLEARATILSIPFAVKAKRPARSITIMDEDVPLPSLGAGYPRAERILDFLRRTGWAVDYYVLSSTRLDIARARARFPGVAIRRRSSLVELRLAAERSPPTSHILVSRRNVIERFVAARPRLDRQTVIFDAEALLSLSVIDRATVSLQPLNGESRAKMIQRETEKYKSAHEVWCASSAIADEMQPYLPKRPSVLSHSVASPTRVKEFKERDGFLFVGRLLGRCEDSPNVDALVWFIDCVKPLLEKKLSGEIRVDVIGRLQSDDLGGARFSKLNFLGEQESLAKYYERARVFIAPTRFLAGVPIKVIEAAAAGLPCVTTTSTARQSGLRSPVELVVADDADAFASACALLYSDAQKWHGVQTAALGRVRQLFSAKAFDSQLQRLLSRAVADQCSFEPWSFVTLANASSLSPPKSCLHLVDLRYPNHQSSNLLPSRMIGRTFPQESSPTGLGARFRKRSSQGWHDARRVMLQSAGLQVCGTGSSLASVPAIAHRRPKGVVPRGPIERE